MSPHPDRPQNQVRELGARFLDLVFPPRCVNCGKVGSALCATCLATIQPPRQPLCARCGRPLAAPLRDCSYCRAFPPITTQIYFASWYEGTVRQAIHALKYKRRRDAARPLAGLLARAPASNLQFDWITFVPLHTTRQADRGYNQAELLAQETARLMNAQFVASLTRTRATADQVGLDGKARRANVEGAFQALQVYTGVRNVLLIDDVYTTGATLNACAAALLDAGVRQVFGLTVARPRE